MIAFGPELFLLDDVDDDFSQFGLLTICDLEFKHSPIHLYPFGGFVLEFGDDLKRTKKFIHN